MLLAAAVLTPGLARAEQVVAVLAFGGDDEGNVRGAVVDPLFNRYTIIHGDKVLDACDELGIPMSRGRNLARCAKRAGVVAVVGGAVQGGKLSLVVFSGGNGQVLAKGAVPCRGRLAGRNLRKAINLVLKGLRKAPKGKRRGRKPPPTKDPSGGFSFDPEPVDRGQPASGQSVDMEEDPLTGTGTPSFDPDAGDPAMNNDPVEKKKKDDDGGSGGITRTSWPALELALGGGFWSRTFTPNDPIQTTIQGKPRSPEEYKSGTAFMIRVMARARPLAFFMEGLATGPFLKLMFQSTAGLATRATDAKTKQVQLFGTGFWGLDFEVGYDWDIFRKNELGPHLMVSLGYSTLDFSIEWPTDTTTMAHTTQRRPNANYSCFLLKLGVAGNFFTLANDWLTLGGHFFFDFRPVLSDVEEIEDPTLWYGAASVNGLGLALGIDGRINVGPKAKVTISLDYNYTRYWYRFDDAATRRADALNKKKEYWVLGGALDEYHGFVVSLGYAM